MTNNETEGLRLNYKYLDWMYDIVCNDKYSKKNTYRMLFEYLYEREFYYILPMDANRFEDGIDLRYRFGRDHGYSDPVINEFLDKRPCSVLEMIMALAIRCEDHIMSDPDLGDRVGQWFWAMIVNLGLGHMNDENFDRVYADEVIDIFLERKYSRDGSGGLFKIEGETKDMRSIDIWYQMCWYLNEVLEDN